MKISDSMKIELLIYVFAAISALVVLISLTLQSIECSDSGGTLVHSLFWYECI